MSEIDRHSWAFPWSPLRQLILIKWIVVCGLLAALCISPRLFLHHPFLGPIPVASWIPVLPPPVDMLVLIVILGLLLPIPFLRNPRRMIIMWCVLFFARCAWDRITWQPYYFQYLFMLISLAFVDWQDNPAGHVRRLAVLNANRLIVACIYFWSGFSKLNYGDMIDKPRQELEGIVDASWIPFLSVLWWLIPCIEMGFACGLLTRRFRGMSIWAGIGMHLLILVIYGPLGKVYNPVIWPWNVAMICFLILLFHGNKETSSRQIIWGKQFALHQVIFILFAVCPLLSYAGWWSDYLSFRLYSRLYCHGAMLMRQSVIDTLPDSIRSHVKETKIRGADGVLHITTWAERQLNAFPPTDEPVIKYIAGKICTLSKEPGDMALLIRPPPNRFTGDKKYIILSCEKLGCGPGVQDAGSGSGGPGSSRQD